VSDITAIVLSGGYGVEPLGAPARFFGGADWG
jgi:hypothetical protein